MFEEFLRKSEDFNANGDLITIRLEGNILESLLPPVRSLVLWKHKTNGDIKKPLSDSLEKEAIESSLKFLQGALEKFTTSVEEDKSILATEADFTMKNILRLRIREKETLLKWVQTLKEFRTILRLS
jgi:hypothetical protein